MLYLQSHTVNTTNIIFDNNDACAISKTSSAVLLQSTFPKISHNVSNIDFHYDTFTIDFYGSFELFFCGTSAINIYDILKSNFKIFYKCLYSLSICHPLLDNQSFFENTFMK